MRTYRTDTKGFIALAAVLVLSAVFVSLSISVASHAIDALSLSGALQAKNEAAAYAHLCTEYALMELERTLNYSGNESIMLDAGSCDILTVEGEGNTDRIVKTESTVNGYTYKLQVSVSEISPELDISSWERVTSF